MTHNKSTADAVGLDDAKTRQLKHQLEQAEAENKSLRQHNTLLRQRVHELQCEIQSQIQLNDRIELLKTALVRNVSHELKTPLLHIKSAIALLSEDIPEGAPNRNLVVYAENATARLESLVRNITILGSSLDIHPSPVILRDSVHSTSRNLARSWQHKSDLERLHIDLEADLKPVLVDKQGLSTVLHLLIENAFKFSETAVTVRARQHERFVRVTVEDHGIGIDEQHRARIFDSFYQIDSSSTRRYGGMGIGLAIVKLILDAQQIPIRVHSQLGKGSTFEFDLPLADLS